MKNPIPLKIINNKCLPENSNKSNKTLGMMSDRLYLT